MAEFDVAASVVAVVSVVSAVVCKTMLVDVKEAMGSTVSKRGTVFMPVFVRETDNLVVQIRLDDHQRCPKERLTTVGSRRALWPCAYSVA